MVSKTAKRKRNRGRPRLEGVCREENGRVTRAKNPANTRYPPDDVIKSWVVRLEKAGWATKPKPVQDYAMKDPRLSTYVGRCALNYETKHMHDIPPADMLDRNQYEASQKYLVIHNSYRKANGIPGAHYEGVASIELSEDEKSERADKTKARWNEVLKVIQEANIIYPSSNLLAALDIAVDEDMKGEPNKEYSRDEKPNRLIGDLRLALNALDRHFKGVK